MHLGTLKLVFSGSIYDCVYINSNYSVLQGPVFDKLKF